MPDGHRWRRAVSRPATGVHRVEDAYTNWYLVEDGDGLTVVDTGVPTSWRSFHDALKRLGRSADDAAAVVLTHNHFDHLGFAEKARREPGDVLIAGDAISCSTRTPRAAGRASSARAAVAGSERNLRSLDALAETAAGTVLTGHGEPWTAGAEHAVARARAAGSA